MDEKNQNNFFSPQDFLPDGAPVMMHEDAPQPSAPSMAAPVAPVPGGSPELEAGGRGSAFGGIVGALLGALVGAIPWFLVSTFTSVFVGWLGFLVGIAACFGYKLFRGKRSTGFATAVVILASVAALFAAEIGSWMYVLCTDPDWQLDAMLYGIPVARLAWEALLMPDNWSIIAPNMLLGIGIGVLGVLSSRQSIVAYTDPARAAAKKNAAAAAQNAARPLPEGFQVPQSFVVRESKAVIVLGVIVLILFGGMLLLCAVAFGDDPDMLAPLLIFAAFTFLGVYLLGSGRKHRLEVDGSTLRYCGSFGKPHEFTLADVKGMTGANLNGTIKLVDHDGKTLAAIQRNMKNSDILLAYLAQRGVTLIAK